MRSLGYYFLETKKQLSKKQLFFIILITSVISSGCGERDAESILQFGSSDQSESSDPGGPSDPDGSSGSSGDSSSPTINFTKKISTGFGHACHITSSGTAKCSGSNKSGQLGNASIIDSTSFVDVAGGLTFTHISSGKDFSCAVAASKKVYCWGNGGSGRLGYGSNSNANTPTQINDTTDYTQVETGEAHACGLTVDGTIKCWGDGSLGSLGRGSTTNSASPVSISGADTYVQVTTGGGTSCGLLEDGTVKCWGSNQYGETGQPGGASPNNKVLSPTALSGSETYQHISGGLNHTCGVTTTNTIRCWGFGMLGDGNPSQTTELGVDIDSTDNFEKVFASDSSTCALTTAGEARCWGTGSYGIIGDNYYNNRPSPTTVSGGLTFVGLSSTGMTRTQCGLTSDDKLYCWGQSSSGVYGNNITSNEKTPTLITTY